MKPLNKDQLRHALERRRAALIEEHSIEGVDVTADPAEAADQSRDFEELRSIDAARRRLDDGSYGICTDCGVDIGWERLRAEPEAARCIDCQRRHETTYRR